MVSLRKNNSIHILKENEATQLHPPHDGGEQFFVALKKLRKEAVMLRFPEEDRELSRSGKPRHRVEGLTHISNWFKKYL